MITPTPDHATTQNFLWVRLGYSSKVFGPNLLDSSITSEKDAYWSISVNAKQDKDDAPKIAVSLSYVRTNET